MKTDRLVSIIMILLEERRTSAARLARMFEVSTRTIYRDIEAINIAGIPIVTIQGANGGIGIMDGYKFDRRIFTTSNLASILSGIHSLSPLLPQKEASSAITKIMSMIPPDQRRSMEQKARRISIDPSPWTADGKILRALETIRNAMDDSRMLRFSYRDKTGKSERRTAEPYRLIQKDGQWYLYAFCVKRNDFRLFRVSRIADLRADTRVFIPRECDTGPLDGAGWIEHRIIPVTLLVDHRTIDMVRDRCRDENITPHGKSDFKAILPFTEDEYGYAFLMGLGAGCECLDPPHVRKELIRRMRHALERYSSAGKQKKHHNKK